ncbi:PREDICTED: uncharacterized protein LOC104602024 [Nelumbo nucifera]|uniref:Uncharacterized protein LOC104602024 n=2 Tax=Nelumbo nucifera TaxID=4432 RepID=A0A1U8AAT2_NELNU|nr:PREDICTED: uncharacterized protein LOC104602024 [Nelumbo nucifera]DAD46931.1 TPA_asm: hypothetical protein HUJ06_016868 [Nelumbo nucifera]
MFPFSVCFEGNIGMRMKKRGTWDPKIKDPGSHQHNETPVRKEKQRHSEKILLSLLREISAPFSSSVYTPSNGWIFGGISGDFDRQDLPPRFTCSAIFVCWLGSCFNKQWCMGLSLAVVVKEDVMNCHGDMAEKNATGKIMLLKHCNY